MSGTYSIDMLRMGASSWLKPPTTNKYHDNFKRSLVLQMAMHLGNQCGTSNTRHPAFLSRSKAMWVALYLQWYNGNRLYSSRKHISACSPAKVATISALNATLLSTG